MNFGRAGVTEKIFCLCPLQHEGTSSLCVLSYPEPFLAMLRAVPALLTSCFLFSGEQLHTKGCKLLSVHQSNGQLFEHCERGSPHAQGSAVSPHLKPLSRPTQTPIGDAENTRKPNNSSGKTECLALLKAKNVPARATTLCSSHPPHILSSGVFKRRW